MASTTQEKLLKPTFTDPLDNKLYEYLKIRLKNKWKDNKGKERINMRPRHLKYADIAEDLGMTYKQVRSRIDKFCKIGILEKYNAWKAKNYRRNYYRLR